MLYTHNIKDINILDRREEQRAVRLGLPGGGLFHVLSDKGGIGHAHQSVGQGDNGQEMLCGNCPGQAVRAFAHNVRQCQLPSSRHRQLPQQ